MTSDGMATFISQFHLPDAADRGLEDDVLLDNASYYFYGEIWRDRSKL
jgi:hypothetical protein